MTPEERQSLWQQASDILSLNDRGHYTVPTSGLYPFQWNWDSCLVALGQAHVDEARAWLEIATLFAHQWPDGMVPHIIFHEKDNGYFPGPDVWNTGRPVSTSGITQPPVAGHCVRKIFETARDTSLAHEQAMQLIPAIDEWHQWFFRCRDPQGTGLVALLHPWEAGRDNSVDWDEPFARVPTDGVGEYQRRDTQHADPAHRPTHAQYDRYLWLLQCFRGLEWDNTRLHDASPFQVVDPGFNAILIRSCQDIAIVADTLGLSEIAARNRAFAARSVAALDTLWSDSHGQYLCQDRTRGTLIDSASIGGLLPVIAALPATRSRAIAQRIAEIESQTRFLVASHDPADARFDSTRYWRGPAWLIVNYLLVDGLRVAGEHETADKIQASSLALIDTGGFAEYHDPLNGAPCGGSSFTWTAAMVMEFLAQSD